MPGSTGVPSLGDAAYYYNGVLDVFGGPVFHNPDQLVKWPERADAPWRRPLAATRCTRA